MKTQPQANAVFFDLGATLVDPVTSANGEFASFKAMPGVAAGLQRMRDAKLRLGIISDIGGIDAKQLREALAKDKLLDFFDPHLMLFSGEIGRDKSTPEISRAHARDFPRGCCPRPRDGLLRALPLRGRGPG